MERKRESQTSQFWWEQVMELEEENGDEGPFLVWDNRRGGAANAGRKKGVNQLDPRKYYVNHPDPSHGHPSFTLEHDLDG